jgi:hypothetical protein
MTSSVQIAGSTVEPSGMRATRLQTESGGGEQQQQQQQQQELGYRGNDSQWPAALWSPQGCAPHGCKGQQQEGAAKRNSKSKGSARAAGFFLTVAGRSPQGCMPHGCRQQQQQQQGLTTWRQR